ncbi:MAG TPA: OmpH family outer membrane protein [Patescibacteria group bacterium]|nr:OmpH family outer membrane protein [Patescibacteria group bacterium]
MFKDKKTAKIVAIAIVAMFVAGIVGIAVSSQNGKGYAAGAGSSSNVGKVNYQMLVSQHPDLAKVDEVMKNESSQAQKDFDEKSKTMTDQQKQEYFMQTKQRLDLKEKELVTPIIDKVNAAIKDVADAKGLAVVMDQGSVVYGGQDLTEEVSKKLYGK